MSLKVVPSKNQDLCCRVYETENTGLDICNALAYEITAFTLDEQFSKGSKWLRFLELVWRIQGFCKGFMT